MTEKEKTIISWPQSGRTWLITMIGHVFYNYYNECDLATKFSDYFGRDIKNLGSYNLHTFPREHEDQAWTKEPQELSTDKTYLNDMYKRGRSLPANIFDVIFLVRHPKDTIISNYLRRTKIKNPNTNFNGSISEFIRSDKGSLKSMIKWLNIWSEECRKPRDFIIVKYENLHYKPLIELKRIFTLLGYSDIPNNILQDAIDFAAFEKMKKMEQKEGNKNHIMFSKNKDFIREGKVGKGKDYLNDKDNKYVDDMIKELDINYGY